MLSWLIWKATIKMKSKYIAAVIGLGRIGFTLGYDKKREQPASHTMALKANKRIDIIAGVDTNIDAQKLWQKANPKARVFSSTNELFQACSPDIVCVAVNESAHMDTALAVLHSTVPVMILEKPVALNMKEGLKIKSAFNSNKVTKIIVNHERRYDTHYMASKEYLSRIGSIQSVTATLSSGMRLYDPREEKTGGYSLIHDGTHLVDIVMFLLDEKLTKPVITGLYYDEKDKGVVRNFSAHYKTKKCPDVTITMSGRSRYFGFDIDIRGTEGRIRVGNGYVEFYARKESKLYTGFYSLEEDKSVKVSPKTLYFSNMIQNAVDYLDGKAEIKSTLETGLDALKVLEDIKKTL
jgi:predicted dehydrogenase